jgi:hypothetical protein
MATHRTVDGRRVTVADPAAPHQITLARGHGRLGAKVMVGCTCGARPIATEADSPDHWAMYNVLCHDTERAPFTRVDPVTGQRQAPAVVVAR